MKKIIYLFIVLTAGIINAQTIKGVVLDASNKLPLAYTNIVLLNGKGVYANDHGLFEIDISNHIHDTLQVSTIGYTTKMIALHPYKDNAIVDLTLLLEPKIEELDEVFISTAKVKYKRKETLGEKRNGNIGMSSLIGSETCIFIDNPEHNVGKLKRVYIDLKKHKNAELTATFNLKFYAYDAASDTPGEALYSKNILVTPKNKKYTLWIDVEDLDIKLPKDGICVGVELINPYGKVKKYTYFGPMFRYTLSDDNAATTWSNYHNTGWKGGSIKHKSFRRFKTGISNPMIGIEVLYPVKK